MLQIRKITKRNLIWHIWRHYLAWGLHYLAWGWQKGTELADNTQNNHLSTLNIQQRPRSSVGEGNPDQPEAIVIESSHPFPTLPPARLQEQTWCKTIRPSTESTQRISSKILMSLRKMSLPVQPNIWPERHAVWQCVGLRQHILALSSKKLIRGSIQQQDSTSIHWKSRNLW